MVTREQARSIAGAIPWQRDRVIPREDPDLATGVTPDGIASPPASDPLEEVDAAVIEIGRDGTLDESMGRWFGGR